MRDYAQDSVALSHLEFLGKYYGDRNVNVWKTSIDYEAEGNTCSDAPLSWKLDPNQQECIKKSWDEVLKNQQSALACIDAYVTGADPKTHCVKASGGKE
jgi:hypothetical protein